MISIEGIRVLNSYTTKEPDLFAAILILTLGIALGVCAVYFLYDNDKLAAIPCFIVSITIVFMSIYALTHITLITHYDVLINDSVSLVEVYDKYKIEGKDGDIYHLILRKQTEEDKAND